MLGRMLLGEELDLSPADMPWSTFTEEQALQAVQDRQYLKALYLYHVVCGGTGNTLHNAAEVKFVQTAIDTHSIAHASLQVNGMCSYVYMCMPLAVGPLWRRALVGVGRRCAEGGLTVQLSSEIANKLKSRETSRATRRALAVHTL